ncbi:NAD-dependent epimerase/dehydratase family protein [Leifsonia sp. NPDC056824]|uniref:NAD-dependent epimerase/dehydratase family protein n=1 Tax=Leifsonia sp. NPDC056824 TaxID=3345953 RepID=UPI0036C03054
MADQRILVTGGSGFIAGHIILQLLGSGHEVRATIRSLDREDAARAALAEAGMTNGDALHFVAADLLDDAGWTEAVDGVDAVLHVASPVHLGPVDDEDDVIVPAREGTLRVLRAARDAGVPRVVLTSAFHAVGFGHPPLDRAFTEADWSPLDGPGMDAYGRSKVLAERAAWELLDGGSTELVTMLPVAVVGPLIGTNLSGANHLVRRVLTGKLPAYPDFAVPFVDVRDVAAAHIAAITAEGAAGERFLLASQEDAVPLAEVGAVLRDGLGERAGRVPPPTALLPDAAVRAAAEANPGMRPMAAELGYRKKVSSEKARRVLGFVPRPWDEAVVAAAESMLTHGVA